MDKKIVRNFLYNTAYQILNVALPFITIPYISRIFNPKDIGIYSSSLSLAQIFLIVGMFGIGAYGTKEIASIRGDKIKLSEKFYQIRFLQKISIFISLLIYIIYFVFFYKGENRIFYLIQSIILISGFVDITWFYIGLEDFKKTVTRNAIVKFGSLILIFILIKQPSQLWLYTLILSLSIIVGEASMWIYLKNILIKNVVKKKYFKNNLIMGFSLLIPQVSYQLYTSFDRTILGTVSTMDAVGMYDQSQKIIRTAIGIVTSLSIVMLPRISNMISNNSSEKDINNLLKKSLGITFFIAMGCTFGIYAISDNFVPWFFGNKYLDIIILLKISSVVCIFTAIGSFLSNQYAIPKGNKKAYMIPIIIAGLVSVILNIILGSRFAAIGSSVSIVTTELIAVILRLFYLRHELNIKFLFSGMYKFIIAGFIMILSINFIRLELALAPNAISTIFEISVGAVTYCSTLIIIEEQCHKFALNLINKLNMKRFNTND